MSALSPEDRRTITRMAEDEWTAAALARDWGRAADLCADDVVYMPADHPALRGRAALRTWLDAFPPIKQFVQPIEVIDGWGDVAMSRGAFTVTFEVDGAPVENSGKVLSSWKRDESGRWMVTAVCWNWDRHMAST